MPEQLFLSMLAAHAAPVARARRSDPASSHEAARRVTTSGAAAAHCARILEALRTSGERLTSSEIAARAGLSYLQVARRMSDLAGHRDERDDPAVEWPVVVEGQKPCPYVHAEVTAWRARC